MEVWKLEGSTKNQAGLALGSLAVGLAIMIGAYNLDSANSRAGFALGALLVVIGLYALLSGGKQVITVDPERRNIMVENSNRFGKKTEIFYFDDIAEVLIGYIGKKSNYTEFYYLILKLKNGQECSLFAPGYFAEGSDRALMESWRTRLEEYLKK